MRLKKLELHGFKSFADRTQIIFDQGVTCIVGPNGCGKSNISDSIRWVLGERSAKMLRGSKMEDVIFNGTDFRKPLAMAEVSLTIDNEDRGLPIDYAEVTITRRLYRSGESEYLINKTVCRLKDIQDLILDTGIGSNSYSMIEQGRIDHILNADPEERRFLVEEAAGISKYKVKKDEAIRKLERTEENLLRLKDIVLEVQRNIEYAERQAKKAERFKEHFEKLKQLEIQKAFKDLGIVENQKNELSEKRSQIDQKLVAFDEELKTLQESLANLLQNLQAIQARFQESQKEQFNLRSQVESFKQQLLFHQEKRLSLTERLGQMQQETKTLQERLTNDEDDVIKKERELTELIQEKQAAESQLEKASADLKKSDAELSEQKFALDETRKESFRLAAELSRARNEYHKISAFLETGDERIRKQAENLLRLEQNLNNASAQKRSLLIQIEESSARSEDVHARRAHYETQITRFEAHIENCERSQRKYETILSEARARLNLLKELDIHDFSQNASSDLFDLKKNPVRDALIVEPGFELAVETALEHHLKAFFIESKEQLFNWLHLNSEKATPINLILQTHNAEDTTESTDFEKLHAGVLKPLLNYVSFKEGYDASLKPLFRNVYVVSEFKSEILDFLLNKSTSVRFVTLDGWMIGPGSAVRYGGVSSGTATSFLKRGSEIRDLESEIEWTDFKFKELMQYIDTCQPMLAGFKQTFQIIESERLNTLVQSESFDSLIRSLDEQVENLDREIQILRLEQQEFLTRREKVHREQEEIQAQIKGFEAQEERLREAQTKISQAISRSEEERNQLFTKHSESKSKTQNITEKTSFLQDTLVLRREQMSRDQMRRNALAEEMSGVEESRRFLDAQDIEIEQTLGQTENHLRDAEVTLGLIRQEQESVEIEIQGNRDSISQSHELRRKEENELHQIELRVQDALFQERNIHERIEQAYKLQLSDLNSADFPLAVEDSENLETKIAELRKKVEGLGTVNLLAIEEYDELKTRYDFLMGQQKDLETAREELLEAIRKINRTTKSLFEDTFVRLQTIFQQYYETLFRGGEARLVLLDESNPLESGVDIVVRPPGKKPQHITLLSGGEKALTAIALLFSLFSIRPSPFCVLDEVDAPLDEANVDRFLNVLRTFLTISQFLIVTHNRKTISMGDSLYGVTMEEAGISKIVSVKVAGAGPETSAKASIAVENTVETGMN